MRTGHELERNRTSACSSFTVAAAEVNRMLREICSFLLTSLSIVYGFHNAGVQQHIRAPFVCHISTPIDVENEIDTNKQVLISRTQQFLESATGFYSPPNQDFYSEEFVFRGGVVGPLNKNDYLDTMKRLGVYKAFDLEPNYFGLVMDESEPCTVRGFIRNSGTHVGDWQPWGSFPPLPLRRSGKKVQGPVESFCVKFEEMPPYRVRFFTTGNVVRYGNSIKPNTGGLGAVLGLFHSIGMGRVGNLALSRRVRKFSNWIGNFDRSIPRTRSKDEDVPQWWKEKNDEW